MLSTNKMLGQGGNGMQGDGRGTVAYMLRQLQQRKVQALAGTTASTNIAVAGITVNDHIGSAFFYSGAAAPVAIVVTVTSAGNVQSVTDTSGGVVMLEWFPDVPAVI